jgi:Ca2+-transporting ATPase
MSSDPTAPWHALDVDSVARSVATDAVSGLSPEEAARRLAANGANELARGPAVRPLAILARQFESLVVAILLAASAISLALGEIVDGAAIAAIVALNATIGVVQELRAERSLAALAGLSAPRARVVRAGRSSIVPAREVVRGDVLLLEAGDLVAADARLLAAAALRTGEAALTGESEPAEKSVAPLPVEAPLADRRNLVFLGTSVAAGTGRAVAVATGMDTEVGRIAQLAAGASRDATPLQRELDAVGRRLIAACLAIVAVVFALGYARGVAPFELFLGAVSLAVAAVPEGLPAVVTVSLALGVERMARRGALIRSLPAVETLGAAQVICTDKTGTLTVGSMTVRRLHTASGGYAIEDPTNALDGGIACDEGRADDAALRDLLHACAACNDAEIAAGAPPIGDPTESALLVAAAQRGERREAIEQAEPRLRTIPFDSDRRRMTIVRRRAGRARSYVKGAPEELLARCTRARIGAADAPLDAEGLGSLQSTCLRLAANGLRVLAVAERELEDPDDPGAEEELTFLGFAGLQDPPRAGVRAAVARCREAGIRTVMITGDHRETAAAIAREIGVLGAKDEAVSGRELDALDDVELAERVERIAVFARVSPEHKLRIVRAWKSRGAVVAMTGDGVNDAPALREAAIGVAMGKGGTEAAKEAADMVLTDDDFTSIVAAVEEGRGVFDNVAKTLAYLLAGNAAELATVLGATLLGFPLPLLPIQLLWINLVTDGLPALALATDPIAADALRRPPRPRGSRLLDRARIADVLTAASATAAAALAVFAFELGARGDLAGARDAAFSTLVFAELLRAFGARSETRFAHEVGLTTNLRLVAVVVASIALQIAAHHFTPLVRLFGTHPATLADYGLWILVGALPLATIEARKAWRRRHANGIF